MSSRTNSWERAAFALQVDLDVVELFKVVPNELLDLLKIFSIRDEPAHLPKQEVVLVETLFVHLSVAFVEVLEDTFALFKLAGLTSLDFHLGEARQAFSAQLDVLALQKCLNSLAFDPLHKEESVFARVQEQRRHVNRLARLEYQRCSVFSVDVLHVLVPLVLLQELNPASPVSLPLVPDLGLVVQSPCRIQVVVAVVPVAALLS